MFHVSGIKFEKDHPKSNFPIIKKMVLVSQLGTKLIIYIQMTSCTIISMHGVYYRRLLIVNPQYY